MQGHGNTQHRLRDRIIYGTVFVMETKITGKSPFGLPNQFDHLIRYFQKANDSDEAWFQVLDMFPIPIEIFAPDGTSVFINRALLELHNVPDASLLIGKYNVIKDPMMTQIMAQMGLSDEFQRVFQGEAAICKDFPAPIQDVMDRGIIEDKPFEKATMDLYNYPVWKDDKLHYYSMRFCCKKPVHGQAGCGEGQGIHRK